MHSIGVLGLSVARSEIDMFVQKDSKQIISIVSLLLKTLNRHVTFHV